MNIEHSVTIRSPVHNVYRALTEENGLKGWWTSEAKAEPIRIGAVSTFTVGGKMYCKLKVDKLEPDKIVEWKCLEQDFHGLSDWIGTTIRFDLTGTPSGTKIHFLHSGWKDNKGLYDECNEGWKHLVTKSLKSFLEKGKGEPFVSEG